MSDGSVIFSHSDLLDPHRHGVTWGLKQKLARTRGENLIHAVPPELPSYKGISWTDNGVSRLSYSLMAFRLMLAGGLQWLFPEETLNL